MERLTEQASGLRPGSDSEASYGPMTLPKQPAIVADHVADTLARGGRPWSESIGFGSRAADLPPVVLEDVPEDSPAVTEETFGPRVLTVTPRARKCRRSGRPEANASHYALGGAVFPRDRPADPGAGPPRLRIRA